jgi:hypothetical protein
MEERAVVMIMFVLKNYVLLRLEERAWVANHRKDSRCRSTSAMGMPKK